MNERIKELAEQATEIVANKRTLADGQIERTWRPEYFNQKFAELIVRECVAICEDTDGEHIADARWGRRCCALEIKEHFGVEE